MNRRLMQLALPDSIPRDYPEAAHGVEFAEVECENLR